MSRERGGYSQGAVERIWERFQALKLRRPSDEARDLAVERTRREGYEVPGDNEAPDVREGGWPRGRIQGTRRTRRPHWK